MPWLMDFVFFFNPILSFLFRARLVFPEKKTKKSAALPAPARPFEGKKEKLPGG
jgi:hypothetical protein